MAVAPMLGRQRANTVVYGAPTTAIGTGPTFEDELLRHDDLVEQLGAACIHELCYSVGTSAVQGR